MGEEVSPEVIQSTQKLLGKHVTKPQLTEKLLKKPPFRFLHDIVNVLVRDGFLKGLYSESELNSENVKEREAKIAFLNKLITAVKALSGKDLKVKASKVVAGLDANETNRLLQTIGKLITDKVDTKEYVKEFKKQSKDDKEPETKKKAEKVSKDKTSTQKLDSTRKKEADVKVKKKNDTPRAKEKEPPSKPGSKVDSSRRRMSQVDKVSTKSSKTSKESTSKSVKTEPKKEKAAKVVASPVIPTPHEEPRTSRDIVSPAIKESPKDEEITQDSTDTTPRETDSWKPQVLDQELPSMAEKSEEEKTVKEVSVKDTNKVVIPETPPAEPIRQISARPKSARPRSGANVNGGMGDAPRAQKPRPESKKAQPIKAMDFSLNNSNTETTISDVAKEMAEVAKKPLARPKSSLLRPPSVRPNSARPGAPRLRPDTSIPMKEIVPLGKINVIIENYDNIDGAKDADDEETVVIENVPENAPQENVFLEKKLDIPADKGHLVEQILEQMQGPDAPVEDTKGQIEWEHENSKEKDATVKEINALRNAIQTLTRTANPLGKLTSYLHEDVEAMHSELETWVNMKKQYIQEIIKQKRLNDESNQPLLKQLQSLEENIAREREEIMTVKFNIMKNEERIRQLVKKQIVID